MKELSKDKWMRFTATVSAMLLAAFAAPFLAHAQSDSANDVIQLVTGEGRVTLRTSANNFCTATSSGQALAIAIAGRCSSFGTSADIPRSLDVKITTGRIVFRNGRQSYVIHDAAAIQSARDLFAPVAEAMAKQSDLGRQMSELGPKERLQGLDLSEAKVKIPDLSADIQKVEADAKRLSSEGATPSALAQLQSEIAQLQSRIAEAQSRAGDDQSELAARQSEFSGRMALMGKQMEAMGDEMKIMGQQGEEAAEQASRQLSALLDQAIASGIAKPE